MAVRVPRQPPKVRGETGTLGTTRQRDLNGGRTSKWQPRQHWVCSLLVFFAAKVGSRARVAESGGKRALAGLAQQACPLGAALRLGGQHHGHKRGAARLSARRVCAPLHHLEGRQRAKSRAVVEARGRRSSRLSEGRVGGRGAHAAATAAGAGHVGKPDRALHCGARELGALLELSQALRWHLGWGEMDGGAWRLCCAPHCVSRACAARLAP